jgi:trehalose 6-phosphate phosphatase
LQEKHNPYVTDKGNLVTWLDAMKAQSPPQFHSLHGDTPESYDMEATEYAAWLVSNKNFKTLK